MTKISNQYSLTNILTADLANSRLGINNVSPTVALDVTGAGRISSSLGVGAAAAYASTTLLVRSNSSTSTNWAFIAEDNATNQIFGIRNNGNVGIGTGSPTAKLEIYDNSNSGILRLSRDAGNQRGALEFGRNNGGSFQTCGSIIVDSDPASVNNGLMYFYTSNSSGTNTERMRITSAGNVGIGTSSPDQQLTIGGYTTIQMTLRSSTTTGSGEIYFGDSDSVNRGFIGYFHNGDYMKFNTAGSERMRITSGGVLFVGCTTQPGAGDATTGTCLGDAGYIIGQRNAATVGFFGRGTDNGELFAFFRGTTQVGNISVTTSATAYNTGSDYRLKEDLKEIKGIEKVSAIKVYDFKWKNEELRMDGVIAHELQEVLPYAVYGEKDGKEMQGVDYSKIVPVLIKAIQELSAKVSLLENK